MGQSIVIMEKSLETGFLEKEVATITINNSELLQSIYVTCEEKKYIYMTVTTDRDVLDWEYSGILDFYDYDVYDEKVVSVEEIEDTYNPEWKIKIELSSFDELEEVVTNILSVHQQELTKVYSDIKDEE